MSVLNACYLREADESGPSSLTRRGYWLLQPGVDELAGIVLVHYLQCDDRSTASGKKLDHGDMSKKRQRQPTPLRHQPQEDEAAAVALQKVLSCCGV